MTKPIYKLMLKKAGFRFYLITNWLFSACKYYFKVFQPCKVILADAQLKGGQTVAIQNSTAQHIRFVII